MEVDETSPETTQTPNRGTSRLPTLSAVQGETTDEGYEVTTQNLEATEDYHSSPEAQSVDTVIPSGSTEVPDTVESDVTDGSSDATTLLFTTTTVDGEDVTKEAKEAANVKEDALLSTLTDFYAQSYNNARLPTPSSTEPPAILSTFIDHATSVLSGDSHSASFASPAGTEPSRLTETLPMTSAPASYSPTSSGDATAGDEDEASTPSQPVPWFDPSEATEAPNEASTGATISYDNDNLLSIDIIDPLQSENPYDVMPLEGQSGAYPLQSSPSGDNKDIVPSQPATEPLNPYANPAILLQVLQNHNQFLDRTEQRPEGEAVSPDDTQDTGDTSPPPTTNLPSAVEGTDDGHLTHTPAQYYSTTDTDGQDTVVSASQPASHPSPSPAAAPPLSSKPEAPTHPNPARPPPLPAFAETSHPSSASSVLPPSQLAATGQQDKIDLETLQVDGDLTEGDIFYDYYGSNVYLDNVPEVGQV